jgi:hypothetical protein
MLASSDSSDKSPARCGHGPKKVPASKIAGAAIKSFEKLEGQTYDKNLRQKYDKTCGARSEIRSCSGSKATPKLSNQSVN